MKRIVANLAIFLAIPIGVMGQPLPTTPPAGYDQGGQYPAGAINSVSYYSSVAGTNLTMLVYTPPGYTASKKYSVIYAYQGIGAGIDTIFAGWCVGAGTLADNLIGQGKIKPVIIVAVDDQFNGTYGSDVRSMTINDAIPYIDSHYSTYADADHRGLYGYSWGGGYCFNVGCENLNAFRYISPSSAAPSKDADATLFPNGGAEAKRLMKLLLISCGNADYLGLYGPSEGAHNYCVNNGIPHVWWPVDGGGHDGGSVWRPHMWNFLQMADAAGISDPARVRAAYSQFEAEDADARSGGIAETCGEGGLDLRSITNGNHAVYRNVDFSGGATNFQVRVASAASGGNIEIRLDSTNGTLVGTCAVTGTGGWQTWVTQTCPVSGATGTHDLYLRFTGGAGFLFNLNWWKFGGPDSPVSLPAAPSGLVATPGSERVVLRWNAASGATSYNVKRATTSGGAYPTIANVAGTNYTDVTAIGGTTHYYVVSALNVGGESADSAEAGALPTVNVPAPWLTRDLGAVGLAGGASFTNGIFTVAGAGADIGGTSDQYRFVYVTNSGDGTIIARVASLEDYINASSKAGVMIRAGLETNAVNAFIAVTPGNGVIWQSRSATGGATSSSSAGGPTAPYWVRLVRSGNTFTGSYSANGTTWTQLGSTSLGMATTVYIGLAITSHNPYTLCSATFDRVTGPGWTPPYPATPTGLTATSGVEQVTLRWTAAVNATSYNIKRATASGGPYTIVASSTTTNYSNTRLAGGTKYYYVVSAVNSLAGESDNSAPANATPTVNVPPPWNTQDIGPSGLWGSAGITNGVITVNGSGDDIWNSADSFRFLYQTNTSDGTFIARVVTVPYSDGWAKAGLMVRESLDPGAAHAFIAVTPGSGISWQYRLVANNGCNNNTTGGSAPYWVKLVRAGSVFTGFCSANGVSWTQMGSVTLTNVTTVAYIGLAVTSHNSSSLCAATFDNVSTPGWPPPLLSANAVALSSSQVNVTWNSLTNATSYNVKRSSVTGGPYTNIASGITATNHTDTVASVRDGYFYVISAMVGGSESTNSAEAAVQIPKLAGAIIGTSGSWGDLGDTITNVFDSDLNTFFDAPNADGAWAGLDFGAGVSNAITWINYCPRAGSESRMVGGVFQGANQANFSGAVTLGTVATQPATGVFTPVNVTNTGAFRYVRYLSPNGGYGNVAEVEFYGYLFSPSAPVLPTPTGLVAVAVSTNQINLSWNALASATNYNVKRSLTNGGPYTTIASGLMATNHADSGLAGGTVYYYVVSAMISGSETTNSAPASAATLSPTLGSLVHRYSFSESGGSSVGDSVGGPVWAGTLPNGGALAGGQLGLSSGAQQYASLPAGIVGNLSNVTIMAWVNLGSVTYWSRLFDFGNDTTSYLYLTPRNGFDYTMRFTISTSGAGGEQKINSPVAVDPGAWHQVAVTLNGSVGILYLDGVAVGTNASLVLNPSSLGSTTHNYLGRSQSGSDPYLNGTLDEFRIYSVTLSAAELTASAALGPDELLSPNSPQLSLAVSGTNLVLTWPVANAGYTVQSRTNLVLGDWSTVAAPALQIVGSNWQVVLPSATNDSIFYRLAK